MSDHHNITDQGIIDILQRVKTIALLGASNKPDRASYKVMRFLLARGYQVFPVNPVLADNEILGQRVYAAVTDIKMTIDMLDVFRHAQYLYDTVELAKHHGINTIWTQLGVIDNKAESLAKQYGITMVVNRCPAIEIPRLFD